jgi:hypothetical protein
MTNIVSFGSKTKYCRKKHLNNNVCILENLKKTNIIDRDKDRYLRILKIKFVPKMKNILPPYPFAVFTRAVR